MLLMPLMMLMADAVYLIIFTPMATFDATMSEFEMPPITSVDASHALMSCCARYLATPCRYATTPSC